MYWNNNRTLAILNITIVLFHGCQVLWQDASGEGPGLPIHAELATLCSNGL
jgi:hypothetical protein